MRDIRDVIQLITVCMWGLYVGSFDAVAVLQILS